MKVLLIKMSSLGDVVHTLPAVTEAASHGVRFDWVVEEAFAPIAAAHPAVNCVLPIAWRRWRSNLPAAKDELMAFVRRLRQSRYDLVVDAQGLWKSALVRAFARAEETWGFDHTSAREGVSAVFYHRHVHVDSDSHAIDRLRSLFAETFAYPLAAEAYPASGIERSGMATGRTCLLCHGTTWPSKHWPENMWCELAQSLQQQGYQILLPAGGADERARAKRIAGFPGSRAKVLPEMSLAELLGVLQAAALVVGVDSGLSHLAAALGVPTLSLYGSTDAQLTGARGRCAINLQAQFPCSPCRSRSCSYRGESKLWQGEPVVPACYSSIDPAAVRSALSMF